MKAVNSVHCYHEYGYVGDLVSLGEGKFIAEEGSEFHQTQALIEAVLKGKTADISKAKFDQHSYGEDDRCIHCENLNPSHVHTWELEASGNTNTDTLKFKCGCGDEYTVNISTTADPTGHTRIHVQAQEPTCTKSGNKEYWICSCGKFYASKDAGEEIPATSVILSAKGHQAGSPEVNETPATCTGAGERTITVKCTVCGKELATKMVPIPALGHTFDESTHKCTKCGNDDPSWNPVSAKVKNLEENAFEGNTTITEAVIPEGVTTIGSNAFKGCTNLKKVTIPNNVTTIGREAFYGCEALTSIEIPDTVTKIALGAFNGCSSLQSIKIPDKVKIIDGKTFYECTNLETVDLPNGLTTIVESAFVRCTSLESINIPDTVTSIGMSAFSECKKLGSITIPASVTTINTYAFRDCTSLKKVIMNAQLSKIADGTFWGCTSLSSITIPDSVTDIGISAFRNCSALTSITIPASVKKIQSLAFDGCTGLTTATFENPSDWKCKYYIASQGSYANKPIILTNSTDNAGYLKGTSQQYPMPSFSRE